MKKVKTAVSTKNVTGKFVNSESLTSPQARAWMRTNAAALLQIALDEDHEWLLNGPEGFSLDEPSRRRLARVMRTFIAKSRL